jgi:hypothetical protein
MSIHYSIIHNSQKVEAAQLIYQQVNG